MRGCNWDRTTSAFVIGVGIGAALGLLFAPKPGDEIRGDILGAVKGGVDGALLKGNRLNRQAQKTLKAAKERVADAAEAAERGLREVRRAVS